MLEGSGGWALSERCQYEYVHVHVRPDSYFAYVRLSSHLPPPRILAQCPSGSNACKSLLKAQSIAQRPPCLSISPLQSSIWSSGGQTNIFPPCFLRANWILNRSSASVASPTESQHAAAPLIAHCDKDRVDIGQRRHSRGDFLVIT